LGWLSWVLLVIALAGLPAGVQAQSDDGLYLAGIFSEANYPEHSMNGSVRAGYEAAGAVV